MKIRFGLVLAMAIGFGTTGCASGGGGTATAAGPAPSASGAARPRDTEDTRQAERLIEQAEAAAPSEARGLYQQALASAEAALTADPRNPLAHRLAAQASLGIEDYQAAGQHFDVASELYPLYAFEDDAARERTWIDLYNQGSPLIGEGDYEGATAIFENANAIYSGRPEAFITLGQLYAQLREHDRALENLDMALAVINSDVAMEMDSATVASWQEQAADLPMMRAQILSDAGRFEDAAAVFRQMVAEDPADIEARRNLAATLIQMGNSEEAFAVFDDILARPGLTPMDLYAVGVGFYQGSEYTRAVEAFARGVGSNPMDRDGIEMWARSLQLDSAYAAIPPVAERWIALDPYNQNGYLVLAQAVNKVGDAARASEVIGRVEGLQVQVNDLVMTRFRTGGARVAGSVANKSLSAGARVTLRFTFYTTSGSPMGTMTQNVTLGGQGMSEVLNVQFDSSETVGGYGYELTVG